MEQEHLLSAASKQTHGITSVQSWVLCTRPSSPAPGLFCSLGGNCSSGRDRPGLEPRSASHEPTARALLLGEGGAPRQTAPSARSWDFCWQLFRGFPKLVGCETQAADGCVPLEEVHRRKDTVLTGRFRARVQPRLESIFWDLLVTFLFDLSYFE